jgi:hypothetical protein
MGFPLKLREVGVNSLHSREECVCAWRGSFVESGIHVHPANAFDFAGTLS